jgi:hypothetical protein
MMTKRGTTSPQISDSAYWKDRADKARRMAENADQQHIAENFLKIAAGYDQLAEQARKTAVPGRRPASSSGKSHRRRKTGPVG